MRNAAHFLLVFIATYGEVFSNQSIKSDCKSQDIKKDNLQIFETPINFRNLTEDENENEKQMMMRLTVSEDVKECMDTKKYVMKINLDKQISEDDVKIGSTATQHIVTVGENYVGIESCDFDESKISDEQLMLLNVLDLDSAADDKTKEYQLIISYITSSELTGFEQNIKNIKINFEDKDQKKTCETYWGVSLNIFLFNWT